MKIRAIARSYTTVGIWLIDDAISISVSYVDRRQRLILYMFKSASGDIIIINDLGYNVIYRIKKHGKLSI